jgi:hypothetical protein
MTDPSSDHDQPKTHRASTRRRPNPAPDRSPKAPPPDSPAPPAGGGRTYDSFLSHNSSDKPAVFEIAKRLRKEGLEPFVDAWHLVPGEPWQEALEEALDESRSCAVFLGPKGFGPWENEEMRAALSRRVSDNDYRVIPVLLPGAVLPERGRLPRFLSRLTWVDFRPGLDDAAAFDRLVSGIRGLAPDRADTEDTAVEDLECPYRGLEVFDEKHAEFFVGREALTQHLVEQLRDDRFLAVIGPSGSGKSSVVRAGLIPELRRGALPASGDWPIYVIRPGQRPMEALASSLVALAGPGGDAIAGRDSILSSLSTDERGLHSIVQLALAGATVDKRVVIVVDQFEEVFTLANDAQERLAFVAALLYASSVVGGSTVVVLTIRADFVGKAAGIPGLADRLSERDVLVSPMDAEDLRRAIVEPAERVGLQLEKGLVDTIIADLGDGPGTLPLLQHTLLELFDGRRGRWLTIDRYREIGGVRGAIAQRAEAIYGRLSPSQQQAARRILLRLTQPGEGTEDTRRRAQVTELVPAGAQATDVEEVVNKLADARLLITSREASGGEVVDVAHEALIRSWPRLQGWIDQDAAGLRIQRRVSESATEWATGARDPSFLDRGTRLVEDTAWAAANPGDLNELERDFVTASQAASNAEVSARQRRTRLTIAGLLAATIGFAALSFVAIRTASDADAARRLADARFLVSEGQRNAAEHPLLGLRLVVAGTVLQEGAATTDDSLKSTLLSMAREGRIATLGTGVQRLYATPDQRRLVISGTDSGRIVDPVDGRVVRELTGFVASLDFMGAGGQIVDVYHDLDSNQHELYHLDDGAPVTLTAPIAWLEATGTYDNTSFVVAYLPPTGSDVAPPSELRSGSDASVVATLPAAASAAFFSPDAAFVVVVYPTAADRLPELRRTSDGGIVTTLPELASAAQMTFEHARNTDDPDIVLFGDPPSTTLWTLGGTPALVRLTEDGRAVTEAGGRAFASPDGSVFIVTPATTGLGEMRRADGTLITPLPGSVADVQFRPGAGDTVVISYDDLASEIRHTADGALIRDLGPSASEGDFGSSWVEFSPDPEARYMALSLADHAELRMADTGQVIDLRRAGRSDAPTDIEFGGLGPSPLILASFDDVQEVRSFDDPEHVVYTAPIDASIFLQSSTIFLVSEPGTSNGTEIHDATSGDIIGTLSDLGGADLGEFSPDGNVAIGRFPPDLTGHPAPPSLLVDFRTGSHEQLSGDVVYALFSDDSSLAVIHLDNGRLEVWAVDGTPYQLADLGVGAVDASVLQEIDRLAVWYTTGRSYLVDLDLVRSLGPDPASLSLEDLLAKVCTGPFAELTVAPDLLRPYFGDAIAPGCEEP